MPLESQSFNKYFNKWGEKYRIDPLLLKAIAFHESRLNPKAKGDYVDRVPTSFGLMQINKRTFDYINKLKGLKYTIEDLFTPNINIMYGARILRAKINKYKNIKRAIIGYNGHRGRFTIRGVFYYNKVKKIYQRLTGKYLGDIWPLEDVAVLTGIGITLLFLFSKKKTENQTQYIEA